MACSKRPCRWACAPVKAPFSWPNNSDSNNSAGIAAILMATNGFAARGLCLCSALATNSLPVPDWPQTITLMFDFAKRPIARNTSCIAGASPMISTSLSSRLSCVTSASFGSTARRTRRTASSRSNGLGKYSKAPRSYEAKALSKSVCAVIMMQGISTCWSRIISASSKPLIPGMRISVISTSG